MLFALPAFGQSIQQEKMQELSFLIGNWEGVSKSYKQGVVEKQVPAFTQISYKLDQSIITLDLQSESLQLHTVFYFDEKTNSYSYNPFYKTGSGSYKAEFIEGKLIVSPSETKRFIFTSSPEGDFIEYGENLVDGVWVKYFEDVFNRVEE
ncbi:hypothetical protein DIT68_02975 [Brumimicrobium oceani]|uniref:DUF1579 domain-containing protein n=2 Tax=Brumimicrobium oceani TaxID=2100725 RepID=A0A2U2XEU2_9FLAO|nr:hypothetical protein DIT68_02975 [Brumimicrobium oceani]